MVWVLHNGSILKIDEKKVQPYDNEIEFEESKKENIADVGWDDVNMKIKVTFKENEEKKNDEGNERMITRSMKIKA